MNDRHIDPPTNGQGVRGALYIHIPFCRAKCSYCDFCSYPGLEHLAGRYIAAVEREIASLPPGLWPELATVYLGGGTPSVLSPAYLGRLLAACRRWPWAPAVEITMEANPGTIYLEPLRAIRKMGVNRLSLGVQSLDDRELRLLGRIHSADQARASVKIAREAGFVSLSLDLIYGLPGQRPSQWRATLKEALRLRPDHLSMYALTIEGHTPLAQQIACGELPLPDDDAAAEMYEIAEDTLAAEGWDHYELSNWARAPEFRCQHNLVYWRNRPYIGVGSAAHSWWDHCRRYNLNQPSDYIAAIEAGREPTGGAECIDLQTEMGETAMLGLRLVEGLSKAEFLERFGIPAEDVFRPAIEETIATGLLQDDKDCLRLTRRGRLLGNEVFSRFLMSAQEWGQLESITPGRRQKSEP